MIIGHISHAEKEYTAYSSALSKGLKYLSENNFSSMSEGRYDLDDGMFALIQEYKTEPKARRRPESHQRYIDIQYIVNGEESIGYCLLCSQCVIKENLLLEKDLIFYSSVVNESDFILKTGMFAVFFPWDIHRPSVSWKEDSVVRKVVLKIPISLVSA